MKMETIEMERWGKDHWSLLAYVECRVVDNNGALDPRNLSSCPRYPFANGSMWKDEYSTRLKGHTQEKPNQVKGNCDWDCLNDLDAEGLIEIVSLINGVVILKPKGLEFTNAVRNHKATGGAFGNFSETKECQKLIAKYRVANPQPAER